MEFRERPVWMDGWTCVPIGRVGRMDGWMDETHGWMTPGARARSLDEFPRTRASSRLVSSLRFPSRVTRRRGDPSSVVTRPRPVSMSARRRRASLAPASRAIPRRTRRHRVRHVGARQDRERDVRGRPPGRAQARQDVPERHRASRSVLVCGVAFVRRVAWCLDDGRGRRARASWGRARARARARGRGGRRARRMTTTTVGVRARGRGTTDAKTTTTTVRTRAGTSGREVVERAKGGEGVGGGRRRG